MNLSGSPLDFIWAFLGGILVSLTPCVYPLIPVSVGFIGANAADSRLKGFFLSLIYVTGIAVTYSILGVFASLTGELFGKISSYGITYIVVGVVIVLFGLSMLDFFSISLPGLIKFPKHQKFSYFSTFVLGLFSGLIIGPCLTPALGTILAILAAKKNIAYGVLLLFSFAYGMGLILILAGTFSSLLLSLPKSGKWLLNLKKIFAGVILLMGIYFIYSGIVRL